MKEPLLRINDLRVSSVEAEILKGVSLALAPGEILGLAGESGSGKSTLLKSIIRLLSPGLKVTGGNFEFDGIDLLSLSLEEARRLRGRRLTLVSQNAMEALNDSRKISSHFLDTMGSHGPIVKKKALREAADLMASLDLSDPGRILASYPFELSGGMCQRVLIALAMIMRPELLMADEPTSALDAAVQAQVVDEMVRLNEKYGVALLIVTHNLGVLAHMAKNIGVMYAGRLVEYGPKGEILGDPWHPYTQALIDAVPDLDGQALRPIEGSPPAPGEALPGCAFSPRCAFAVDICYREAPGLANMGESRLAACHMRLGKAMG
ncbi:MAG: ABC transporter ATP-binding protein [Deltaproteobacteria bacterium]|nr:ABC transporter ATP-binding protein [Deltaproteobacteria bacterium]